LLRHFCNLRLRFNDLSIPISNKRKKNSSDHQSDDLHKTAMVLARLPTHNTDKTIATQNFCIFMSIYWLFILFLWCGRAGTIRIDSTCRSQLNSVSLAANLFITSFRLPVHTHTPPAVHYLNRRSSHECLRLWFTLCCGDVDCESPG
jgi:hypothetical protein